MAVMMMHVQAGERWCHHTTYLAGEDAHANAVSGSGNNAMGGCVVLGWRGGLLCCL